MKDIKQIIQNLQKQDEKTVINLIDDSILADSYVQSIVRCGDRRPNATDNIAPEKVQYVHNRANWDGITYFTDKTFNAVNQVSSPVKIAWVIEPKNLLPPIYEHVVALENEFDLIFTYEQELLDRNPEKYKFQFCDAINIDRESISMHEKNKLVSMIASEKIWLITVSLLIHMFSLLSAVVIDDQTPQTTLSLKKFDMFKIKQNGMA